VRLKSLLESLDLNEAWRREVESSRVSQSVCKLKLVANLAREAWGHFIAPPRESSCWGIRDLDMSGSGTEHVRQISLELGWGTEQVRFWSLTRDKAKRADMSGLGAGHVRPTSLEPGLGTRYALSRDLVTEESG
jgi:hypothetical protein